MDLSEHDTLCLSLHQLHLCNEVLYPENNQDPVFRDVQLKRAQRFLTFHLYSKSLHCSESILLKEPHEFRAQDLKVKALFGLGKYTECVLYLSRVQKQLKAQLALATSDTTNLGDYGSHRIERHLRKIGNLLKDARNLVEQQKWGFYDMSFFLPNRKIKFESVAEFQGPVQITCIEGKGRGVIATRDIHSGELLMVARAFEVIFDEGDEDALEQSIAQKLRLDPSLIPEVYQLFAGGQLGYLTKGQCVSPQVDMNRIVGICTMNAFGNSRNLTGYGHDSRGLWLLPSFFNHDCIDFNAMWKVLGDFIFVRAYKEVKKGEELLIAYTDSAEVLEERVKFFQAHEFLCQCRLCHYQHNEGADVRAKRNYILNQVEKIDTSSNCQDLECIRKNISFVEQSVQDLDEIARNSDKPEWDFSVHVALDVLCKLYLKVGDLRYKDVAERYYKVVNGLGQGQGQDQGLEWDQGEQGDGVRAGICMEIGAAGQVASVFLKAGDLEGTRKWIKVLKKDLTLIYGPSDVFKLIYPVLYSGAKKKGITELL